MTTKTVQNTAQQRVTLSPDDLVRVRRLTEEVKSRLYEVALIMGRTLDRPVPVGTMTRYEQTQDETLAPDQTIEVIVVRLPDGTYCCTQDPPGECVCPC